MKKIVAIVLFLILAECAYGCSQEGFTSQAAPPAEIPEVFAVKTDTTISLCFRGTADIVFNGTVLGSSEWCRMTNLEPNTTYRLQIWKRGKPLELAITTEPNM